MRQTPAGLGQDVNGLKATSGTRPTNVPASPV
jgi:hypothetical protein